VSLGQQMGLCWVPNKCRKHGQNLAVAYGRESLLKLAEVKRQSRVHMPQNIGRSGKCGWAAVSFFSCRLCMIRLHNCLQRVIKRNRPGGILSTRVMTPSSLQLFSQQPALQGNTELFTKGCLIIDSHLHSLPKAISSKVEWKGVYLATADIYCLLVFSFSDTIF